MRTKSLLIAGLTVVLFAIVGFTFPGDPSSLPEGWIKAGNKPKSYDMGVDAKITHSGKNSAFIRSNQESIDGFGTLMQTFKADMYLGKRVRMTGFLKSNEIKTWSGMWMRVDDKMSANPGQSLSFDNMQNRPIKGTMDWTKCEIVLDVPANSSNISFGALLDGVGQVWFDDIKFEVVDVSVPTTDTKIPAYQPPSMPLNLDFER